MNGKFMNRGWKLFEDFILDMTSLDFSPKTIKVSSSQ